MHTNRSWLTRASLGVAAVLLGAFGTASLAQIKRFSLEEMVQTADHGIYGQITGSRVFRVDSERDGEGLYYTELTILGRTLEDGQVTTVNVTFRGGFVSPTEGVYNSEAPAADDVKVGKRVVAFYRWADDMGGSVHANALVAAHGGLYRTVETPGGPAVLGRGDGYAVPTNRYVSQLESSVRLLAASKPKR
jgi:hypothetical protein